MFSQLHYLLQLQLLAVSPAINTLSFYLWLTQYLLENNLSTSVKRGREAILAE